MVGSSPSSKGSDVLGKLGGILFSFLFILKTTDFIIGISGEVGLVALVDLGDTLHEVDGLLEEKS